MLESRFALAPPMNPSPSTIPGPDRANRRPSRYAPQASDNAAEQQKGTRRSILAAIGANVAIAIAKGVGAFFSGSGGLVAEALHSASDTGNGILLLLGQREAKQPATADHPLGKGRATYFWSFVVALLLFTGSGVVSIYEGIGKLSSGGDLESPMLAIGILGFAFVAEGASQLVTLRSIRRRRGRFTLWQWLRNTRHSELIVTFAEDAAALVGIAIALAAVIATWVTGNEAYDASGSIAIGVLLILVAIGLSVEIKSLLIGESAAPPVREAMRAFLAGRAEIVSVAHLITSQHGDDLIVAIKARMDPALDAKGMVAAIAACEEELAGQFPQVTWVFFEPVD
jgi:cation diffusion facilitator family transporter